MQRWTKICFVFLTEYNKNQTVPSYKHKASHRKTWESNLLHIRLQIMQGDKMRGDTRKAKWPLGRMSVLHKQSLWGRCRQHSRQMTGPGCFSEHLVKLHRANIGPVTNTCQCTPTLSPSSGRCETEASQTSGSIPLIVISTLLRFHQILLRNRFTLGSVYLNLSLLFKYRRLYALKQKRARSESDASEGL